MIHTAYEPNDGLEPSGGWLDTGPGARPGGEPAPATRDRILDAAERLFAENGFAATSHRQITAAARVNLAAVNYHFGSKEELFLEVVRRRLEPVNVRRLEMLAEAERRAGGARLADVVRAFVEPVVQAREAEGDAGVLPKLMARVVGEPGGWAEKLLPHVFASVAARFVGALARLMPEMKREDLVWGLVYSAGVISQHMLLGDLIRRTAGGAAGEEGSSGTVDRMVSYITAGLEGLRRSCAAGAPRAAQSTAKQAGKGRKKAKGRKKE